MPVARYQMPDGRIGRFEVPDGTTPEQAQQIIEQYVTGQQGDKILEEYAADPEIRKDGNFLGSLASIPSSAWEGVKTAIPGAHKLQAAVAAGVAAPFVDQSYGDLYNLAKTELKDERNQSFQDNPLAFGLGAIGGGIATGMAASNVFSRALPQTTSALASWGAANPYKAAALAGGASGGVYGAAGSEGTFGERAGETAQSALGGAALAPLALFGLNAAGSAARSVLPKTKGLAGYGDEIASQADELAPTEVVSEITDRPVSQTPELKTIREKGQIIGLSPGIRSKDYKVLLAEEQARQGLLGDKAKQAIDAIDQGVDDDVKNVIQSMIGKKTGRSKEILETSVESFRNSAESLKNSASMVTSARDDALVDAIGDVRKIGPSLGKELFDVSNDPKLKFRFNRNPEAKGLLKEFKGVIKQYRDKGNEIPMGELMALRGRLTDFMGAHTDSTGKMDQAGNLAKEISKRFDGWLENIDEGMILSGNKDVGKLINLHNQTWKKYYGLFEGNVKLKGVATDYSKTPLEYVDAVFGSSLRGGSDTAKNIRMMVDALPDADKQEFVDNVFSGMVAKSFEKATEKGGLSYASLRNSLNDIYNSDSYRLILKTAERDDVLPKMIADLNQVISQKGRRDVISPSGGAVGRFVQNLGKLPGMGVISGAANKVIDESGRASSRITLDRAIKQAGKEIRERAGAVPVYQPNKALMGYYSGVVTGQSMAEQEKQNATD